MKKRFLVLILAVTLLASACTPKRSDISMTPSGTDTPASTTPQTQIPSIPETESTMDAETAPEPEILTAKGDPASRNIMLNAAALRSEDGIWALGSSKVYFGQYDGIPTAYRVLSLPETQSVSADAGTLLLDCDAVLRFKAFDEDFRKNEGQALRQNEWKGSDVEAWLNGTDFYGSSAVFSALEKAAIASTTLEEVSQPYYAGGSWTYADYASTDHVFLLSAAEVYQLYAAQPERQKGDGTASWWTRSAVSPGGNGNGSVHGNGHICDNSVTNFGIGLSPALNIQLSSILFVSAAKPEGSLDAAAPGDDPGNTWKLTLLDPSKTITVTDGQLVTRTGDGAETVVTVPYTYTGAGVDQISVLITDRAYSEENAQVLYYGPLQTSPAKTTGLGAFLLPDGLGRQVCKMDYYAYILAEDRNGDQQTDYASSLCSITIPAAS